MTKLILKNSNINVNKIKELSKKLFLDEVVIRILFERGYDTEYKINAFLYADLDNLTNPYLYTNMDKVVKRIKEAIENDEKILIYGDYDCDGIGAVAILYLTLAEKGITADYYIPSRSDEGYGLSIDAIDKIKNDFSPDIIITVDCGISSLDEIKYIKKLGMDVIVTDHHKYGEILPNCIVLNPCFNENLTPLCGTGVVFMLIIALFGKKAAIKYLDICAISTIADLVPLRGDNRIIAKYGIRAIKKGKCRKGIKQLLYISNTDLESINTYDIAFKIAPRLNAAGRLNSAYSALSLLIEDDLTIINIIAEELEFQNKTRQKLNNEIYIEARKMLASYNFGKYKIIILKDANWNEGVLGIVAAKLAEDFNKPVILFTQNGTVLKGSARSVSGINIYEVLKHCEKYFLRFGGHAMAAGIGMEEDNFENFIEEANNYINSNCFVDILNKVISYDAEIPIKTFNENLFNQFMMLEPYGQSNPRPIFLDRNTENNFKQISNTNHIKMRAKNGEILAFNHLDKMNFYNSCAQNIIYTVDKNYYKGREYNQFKVKDIIPEGEIPCDSILFGRYLSNFVLNEKKYTTIPFSKYGDNPILYIAFIGKTFHDFINENNKLCEYIFSANFISDTDSAVLSPDRDFPFEYYNKIIVLDDIPSVYKNFLCSKVSKVEVIPSGNDFQKRVMIENLREDYIFFHKILSTPYPYTNEYNMYNYFIKYGYAKGYDDFLSAFYTFIDVELIIKSKNDILVINNNKVNMGSSPIFRYLTRE